MEQLRELFKEIKDETVKELKEDNKKLSDRLQALELKQQRFTVTDSQEEKSDERDNHTTEARGIEITPPEK